MNKESEVGPYLMNVFHFVMFHHHFHTHLTPCGHSYNVTDIPFTGMFHYLIQLFFPIFHCSNSSSWFIKCLKPEWPLFSKYTTEITGIPTCFSFLQIRCPTNHQESLCHCIIWKVLITKKCDQLLDIVDSIATQHFFSNRNIFTCCFRCARTKCIVFYFPGPRHIGNSFQCFLPPFSITFLVIINGTQ